MQQADIDINRYIITGILSFMILAGVIIMFFSYYYNIEDIYEKCELKKGYVAKIYECTTCESISQTWIYDVNFINNIGRKKESSEYVSLPEHHVGDSIAIFYDKRNDDIYIHRNKTQWDKIKWHLERGLFWLLWFSGLSLMLYFFRKVEMVSADSEED